VGVETRRTRVGREFGKERKDRGTSGRFLRCLTVRASRNSILIQQSRLVLPSLLALPFLIALPSLLASAALLQASHSQTETRLLGDRVRRFFFPLFFSFLSSLSLQRLAFPRALYLHKRALLTPCIFTKEHCIFTKQPYISTNDICISEKEPYISSKGPCISANELCICTKDQ